MPRLVHLHCVCCKGQKTSCFKRLLQEVGIVVNVSTTAQRRLHAFLALSWLERAGRAWETGKAPAGPSQGTRRALTKDWVAARQPEKIVQVIRCGCVHDPCPTWSHCMSQAFSASCPAPACLAIVSSLAGRLLPASASLCRPCSDPSVHGAAQPRGNAVKHGAALPKTLTTSTFRFGSEVESPLSKRFDILLSICPAGYYVQGGND